MLASRWKLDLPNDQRRRASYSSKYSSYSYGLFSQKSKLKMSDIILNTIPLMKGALIEKIKKCGLSQKRMAYAELRGSTLILSNRRKYSLKRLSTFEHLDIYDISGAESIEIRDKNKEANLFYFQIKLFGKGKTLVLAAESNYQRSRWIQELDCARVRNGPENLKLLSNIGVGHFGKVVLAQKKDCMGKEGLIALKEIKIVRDAAMRGALTERMLLASLPEHPFVISMKMCFRHGNYLYYGFDFKQGADLFEHIRKHGIKMNLNSARFYMAQIVLALRHLHLHNIIYRDLKPENVLVDEFGNLCVADLGLSKKLPPSGITFTICGTRSYLAPEMIETNPQGYSYSVDFWQLGCFLYELYAGRSPFWISKKGGRKSRADSGVTALRILNGQYSRPRRIDDLAWSLVLELLEREPVRRLGTARCGTIPVPVIDGNRLLPGWNQLANHPFFNNVDWAAMYDKEIEPPHAPAKVHDDNLVVNFNVRLASETPQWGHNEDLENRLSTELLHTEKLFGFEWTRPRGRNEDSDLIDLKDRSSFLPSDGTASTISNFRFKSCQLF